MNLEFIGDGPALVVTGEERNLVVADLHFGIEADLALHGLHFRSRSKARLERLLAIVDRVDPDGLLLLGMSSTAPRPSRDRNMLSCPASLRHCGTGFPCGSFPVTIISVLNGI
jgi:metallophosphoesterase superfamily enzyme